MLSGGANQRRKGREGGEREGARSAHSSPLPGSVSTPATFWQDNGVVDRLGTMWDIMLAVRDNHLLQSWQG